jgi:hypothetical protein
MADQTETFTMTESHLKLTRQMWLQWQSDEFGAPEVDPKRPYGNSFVEGDVADILGWERLGEEEGFLSPEQEREAQRLHRETLTVLEILFRHPETGIQPGTYRSVTRFGMHDQHGWQRVADA